MYYENIIVCRSIRIVIVVSKYAYSTIRLIYVLALTCAIPINKLFTVSVCLCHLSPNAIQY